MNTRTTFYDWQAHEYYDPTEGRRVWGFSMPKLETVRWRVCVTNGKAALDSDGKPATAYRHSLADKSTVVFCAKTFENAALEDDGDVTIATSGFATGDSWHALASGIFVHDTVAPLSVAAGIYYPEFVLFDSDDETESLDSGEYDQTLEIRRRTYTGGEDSAPSGTGGGNWYSGTITAGNDNTGAIAITGFTATGHGIPVQVGGAPVGPLSYTKASGSVTVYTSGPVAASVAIEFRVDALT